MQNIIYSPYEIFPKANLDIELSEKQIYINKDLKLEIVTSSTCENDKNSITSRLLKICLFYFKKVQNPIWIINELKKESQLDIFKIKQLKFCDIWKLAEAINTLGIKNISHWIKWRQKVHRAITNNQIAMLQYQKT